MSGSLRVLIAQDSEKDVDLIVRRLELGGYSVTYKKIVTPESMTAFLDREKWDLVISDFIMLRFSGLAALALIREREIDLPLIVVSGRTSEETAVEILKSGAHDYIMKENLARLVPAVKRELREAEVRRERRQAQEALRIKEEYFRQLAENIQEVFFLATADGTSILYISPTYEIVWGRSCESLYADPRSWLRGIHPEDLPHVLHRFQDDPANFQAEYRLMRPDGTVRWIWARSFPIKDDKGKVYRLAGIAEDISRRKELEEALQQNEERFRQLAENITEVFWMSSVNMSEILYISPGYEKIWGRSCESLYRRPTAWLDAIHPEDRGRVEKSAVANEALGTYDEEYRILRPDRSIRWIRDRAFPIKDASGQVYRIAGIAQDITDRKLAEKALEDAKEFSENLIQTANVIILGLDIQGDINIFNQAAEKITGYTAAELNGKNFFEILVPKDRYSYVWEEFKRLIEGGAPKTFESPILTKPGKERYVIWRHNQVRVDGKIVGTISFGNDITDFCQATTQYTRWENVQLTKREKEVLAWVMAGKSNCEISAILDISEHGVDFHLRNLFKKLGVTSRVGAALRGVQMGLIDPD